MSSTNVDSSDWLDLPGRVEGESGDLDGARVPAVRAPAALQPTAPANSMPLGPLRKVADISVHRQPSLLSVVSTASSVAIVAKHKQRIPMRFWAMEFILFLMFICMLSALLIEGRDTTSVFTCPPPPPAS